MKKLFLTLLLTGCFTPAFATEITGGREYEETPKKIEITLKDVDLRFGQGVTYNISTTEVSSERVMHLFCSANDDSTDTPSFIYRNSLGQDKEFRINSKSVCKLIAICLEKDEVTLTLDPASLTVTKAHLGPGCDTKIDPRPYEYTNVLEEDYTLLDV